MDNYIHATFKADDRSYFAIIKKEIHALAMAGGFDERRIGEIDIIVAELVTNLVKHAGGGQVLVKLVNVDDLPGIEIISIDSGPGMTDVTRMMADGVSTKNTLGHGLGAMKRLSDTFQVYSHKNWGTVILIRVFKKDLPYFHKTAKTEIKSVVLPKPGETACGDRFFSRITPKHIKLFLGDGLGHGPEAAKAVSAAGEAFHNCEDTDPVQIIRYMNAAVKKTRGLVGTAAILDLERRKWKICGVGNITTKMVTADNIKNHISYNGIIGMNIPNSLNAQEIETEKGQTIIMCSDGLKSRWDISKYPAILRYDLSILGAALIKDYARLTDDISVVACKINT